MKNNQRGPLGHEKNKKEFKEVFRSRGISLSVAILSCVSWFLGSPSWGREPLPVWVNGQREELLQASPTLQQILRERVKHIKDFQNSCSNNWQENLAPDPYITPLQYTEEEMLKRAFTLDEGPFSFSGSDSLDFDGETFPLELFWRVMAPDGSKVQGLWGDQVGFSFQPDMPGSYKIYLIAKSTNTICAYYDVILHITDNTPYLGPFPTSTREEFVPTMEGRFSPSSIARDFPHLSAIGALEARETSLGEGVVIAILDTGVNYNHPDLRENMWQNEGEIPGNGEDDDLNGIIDDVVGYDCVHNDVFPMDDEGHGTLVAGLAAAKHYGVAPKAKIMAVKVLGRGFDKSESVACGIRYAVDEGADILNLSLMVKDVETENGEYVVHPLLASSLSYAEAKGVIVVVSAGNGDRMGVGYNIDRKPRYPVSFPGDHMVGVAATRIGSQRLTGYSNYGIETVDLAAPGGSSWTQEFLKSAYYWPQSGRYLDDFWGTSAASPLSSASLALLKSADFDRDYQDYIEALVLSGRLSKLFPLPVRSQRRFNVAHAQRILLQELIPAKSLPTEPFISMKWQ